MKKHIDLLMSEYWAAVEDAEYDGYRASVAEAIQAVLSQHNEMYEVLRTIEHAVQVPEWLWNMIQRVIAKADGQIPSHHPDCPAGHNDAYECMCAAIKTNHHA